MKGCNNAQTSTEDSPRHCDDCLLPSLEAQSFKIRAQRVQPAMQQYASRLEDAASWRLQALLGQPAVYHSNPYGGMAA